MEVVFLALTDHESQKGDRSSKNKLLGVRNKAKTSGNSSQDGPDRAQSPRISYSVSYFTWSVSDQSSDEEVEQVTLALDRVKLRRTSRERNGALRDRTES